jgi:hypothetical protein
MTDSNSAAFARSAFYHPDGGMSTQKDGLTKREYFASMAMQGMLANNAEGNTEWDYETIAKHSCKAADALINQLNQKS